jgi:hypothetical protein
MIGSQLLNGRCQLIVADFKDVKTNYDDQGELVQQNCLSRPSRRRRSLTFSPGLGVARYIGFGMGATLLYDTVEAYIWFVMVTITFPDRETEQRALAFLLGRFSGHVLRSGEHIVPEAALEALADQDIPFTVKGKTTYEQQMAAIRGPAPTSVQ